MIDWLAKIGLAAIGVGALVIGALLILHVVLWLLVGIGYVLFGVTAGPFIMLYKLYLLLPERFRARVEAPGRRVIAWWHRHVPDPGLLVAWLFLGGYGAFFFAVLFIVPGLNRLFGLRSIQGPLGPFQWLVVLVCMTLGLYLCLRGYRWHLDRRARRASRG